MMRLKGIGLVELWKMSVGEKWGASTESSEAERYDGKNRLRDAKRKNEVEGHGIEARQVHWGKW